MRIIGGRWRSRRLSFPDCQGLRPSPDRVRVTLFNWVAPHLAGARCLDLFAGSGCLGLEALSRGAREAVFVERNHDVAEAIRGNIVCLQAQGARVIEADSAEFLAGPALAYDLVFVDPPFGAGLIGATLTSLAQGWLGPSALVYVESANDGEEEIAAGWETVRDRSAGHVRYRLLRRFP